MGVHSWLNRRFLKLVILFSLLHFLVMVAVDGVIYLAAHIPPKAVNLDAPIRWLQQVYEILRAPRFILRWLWPGEHSPLLLNWLLTILNSLVWGVGLAGLGTLWAKMRK